MVLGLEYDIISDNFPSKKETAEFPFNENLPTP
jgi:hypothetical protein